MSVLSVAMTLDAHKYRGKNVFVVYVPLSQIFPPFFVYIKACLVGDVMTVESCYVSK